MTIEDPAAFLSSIWDWGPLRGCFPRGIAPTDIDAWVEIGGYFLVIEGKAPGVPLKDGQRFSFERMEGWNRTIPGLFTMIVIWGHADAGQIEQLQFWPSDPFPAGWNELRSYCTAWAECAEERSTVPRAVTWMEFAQHDGSLRAFVDAEIARAGIALKTATDDAKHWKEVAHRLHEQVAAAKQRRSS